jgi:hypothetical protein
MASACKCDYVNQSAPNLPSLLMCAGRLGYRICGFGLGGQSYSRLTVWRAEPSARPGLLQALLEHGPALGSMREYPH